MKAIYIVPSLNPHSGWGRWTLNFFKYIYPYVKPVIIAPLSSQSFIHYMPSNVKENIYFSKTLELYPFFQSKGGGLNLLKWYFDLSSLKKSLEKYNINFIHSLEGHPYGFLAMTLSKLLKVNFCITIHGTYGILPRQRILDRWIFNSVLKNAKHIYPVSNWTSNVVKESFNFDNSKVNLLKNAIDITWVEEKKCKFIGKLNKENHPKILSVGAIKPRKGYEVAIRAFGIVKSQIREAKYYIVGSFSSKSSYFQMLQKQIKNLRLEDNVIFLGNVRDDELIRHYLTSDVFVLTPRYINDHFEGFGLIFLEANAFGLPVISTISGGTSDAILDGVTGYLFEEGDVKRIAQAILDLLVDKNKAKQIGKRGMEWVRNRSWDDFVKEQVINYKSLLT